MAGEITIPLQTLKAVVAGTRRVGNDLNQRAYWAAVNEAGLDAMLQTGLHEVVLQTEADAYGEPSPEGGPIEITHRFQRGVLSRLGAPEELLLQASLLGASAETKVTNSLSILIQKGVNVGEEITAVATLQSVTRTAVERTEDIRHCAQRLERSTRALDSRAQQLLDSPVPVSRESVTQILHRRTELAERQRGLRIYQQRVQSRLESARIRLQNTGLPEVISVAAEVSGLQQSGVDVEVEVKEASLFDATILAIIQRIAVR